MSYRRVRKKQKTTNYCIRFGRSLWSANQLSAQGINNEFSSTNNFIITNAFRNFEVTTSTRLSLRTTLSMDIS